MKEESWTTRKEDGKVEKNRSQEQQEYSMDNTANNTKERK